MKRRELEETRREEQTQDGPGRRRGMAQDDPRIPQGELMRAQMRLVSPGQWIKRAQDDPG